MADKTIKINVKNDLGGYDNLIVSRARQAEYASEDHSKGTIEERLTNLQQIYVIEPIEAYSGVIIGGSIQVTKFIDSYIQYGIYPKFATDSEGYFTQFSSFFSIDKFFIGVIPTGFRPSSTIYDVLNINVTYSIPLEGVGDVEINDRLPIKLSIESNGNVYLHPSSTSIGLLNRRAFTIINDSSTIFGYVSYKKN